MCSSKILSTLDRSIALCRCEECGFIFRNPRPSIGEIEAYYSSDVQYGAWLSAEKARDAMWRRRLKKIVRYRAEGRLLDVGTGIGQFLHLARSRFTVEGTEVSESARRIAAEKYSLFVRHGSLEEIADTTLHGCRFDIVTLFHVLEHVPSPAATLAACRGVLADGGILVVAVPNDIGCWKRPLGNLFRLAGMRRFHSRGMFGLKKLELDEPGHEIHLSHFTVATLWASLEREGFRVREMSLDPFYAAVGVKAAVHKVIYAACSMIRRVFGTNIYDTIWAIAEKG